MSPSNIIEDDVLPCVLLGLPFVATLIALFDDDVPWGQDRRWQYS
jgi:hypothetical protein